MQDNLKKLTLTCIQGEGVLQKTKAETPYCSMLPLEGKEFPCPYSGALIDVGERFNRYRCFYRKDDLEFMSEGRFGGTPMSSITSNLEVHTGSLVQISSTRDGWDVHSRSEPPQTNP